VPSGEQLSSLFRTLGFDTPFLGAGDRHRGVKCLQFGLELSFQCGYAIALFHGESFPKYILGA
jgi:hypothetical protein